MCRDHSWKINWEPHKGFASLDVKFQWVSFFVTNFLLWWYHYPPSASGNATVCCGKLPFGGLSCAHGKSMQILDSLYFFALAHLGYYKYLPIYERFKYYTSRQKRFTNWWSQTSTTEIDDDCPISLWNRAIFRDSPKNWHWVPPISVPLGVNIQSHGGIGTAHF
jgi:hypothetical protein